MFKVGKLSHRAVAGWMIAGAAMPVVLTEANARAQ